MNHEIREITRSVIPPDPRYVRSAWFSGPVNRADWLLRLAVLVYTVGVAVAMFTRAGSFIGGIALMEWGVDHDRIFFFERITALGLLFLAISLLVYPTVFSLLLIAGAAIAEGYASARFGGNHFSEYTLLAHAPRFMIPLSIVFLVSFKNIVKQETQRILAASWILRIGLASVFCIHGLEALWHHPQFVDLIIGSGQNMTGIFVGETSAAITLSVIGAVDITVAFLILVRPWRAVLAWMCFWGIVTALSRPLAFGLASYPEVLLRASHFLAPVALWLLLYPGFGRNPGNRPA